VKFSTVKENLKYNICSGYCTCCTYCTY